MITAIDHVSAGVNYREAEIVGVAHHVRIDDFTL